MYIVKGLSFNESKIKYAEDRYKIPIRQYPHPQLTKYLHWGVCCYEAYETKILKWGDIENMIRVDTGIDWIASGWKKTDSLERRGALSTYRLNAINDKSKKFYPLAAWNDKTIYSYLQLNKIQIPFTGKRGQFETTLEYANLKFMKENYLSDYNKILAQFPFAESIIKKRELYVSN